MLTENLFYADEEIKKKNILFFCSLRINKFETLSSGNAFICALFLIRILLGLICPYSHSEAV